MSAATSRAIGPLVKAMMTDHGFATVPPDKCWWYRRRPDGSAQAVRLVIWGLGSKPNPKIGGELVLDVTPERVAARQAELATGSSLDMDLWSVSLSQAWSAVRAEFEQTVLPRLDVAPPPSASDIFE